MGNINRIIGANRGWVAVQTILLTSIALAGPFEACLRRKRPVGRGLHLLGGTLVGGAGLLASRARADLAASFTMSPTPLCDAKLVDTGIYGSIRHPMYTSVLIAIAGYAAFWRSRSVSLGLLVTLVYLFVKIRYEEQQLTRRYPAYSSYKHTVPARLIPRVY